MLSHYCLENKNIIVWIDLLSAWTIKSGKNGTFHIKKSLIRIIQQLLSAYIISLQYTIYIVIIVVLYYTR